MPRRAPTPCRAHGCPSMATSSHGYCVAHQGYIDAQDRQRRGSAAQRGYGPRWAKYSRLYRQHYPWCLPCEARGERTPSALVDHITPHHGPTDPLFWDPTNHQPMCWSCHSRKTTVEDKLGIARTPRPSPITPTPTRGLMPQSPPGTLPPPDDEGPWLL